MSLKINYLNANRNKFLSSNIVLFSNEKFKINNLKNYISKSEFIYIEDLLKTGDTKKNIFVYSILLFPVAIAPYYLDFLGLIYLLFSFPLSAYYIFICFRLLRTKDKKSERSISKQIFAFSILYLFAIFISILVDKFA